MSRKAGKKEEKRERKADKKEAKAARKAEKRARKAAKKGKLELQDDADYYEYQNEDSELISEDLLHGIQKLVADKIEQEDGSLLSVRVL